MTGNVSWALHALNSSKISILKLPFLNWLLISTNVYMSYSYQPPTPDIISNSEITELPGDSQKLEINWEVTPLQKHINHWLWYDLSLIFSRHCPPVKLLYTTLVCPHLTYCSQQWLPYLIKDILSFERIQLWASKQSAIYKTRTQSFTINVAISSRSRIFSLQLAKSLKSPTRNFDITNHITFSQGCTRSSTHNKLRNCRQTLIYYCNTCVIVFYI